MNLNDRLRISRSLQPKDTPGPAASGPTPSTDPLVDVKHRAQEALFLRLGAKLYDASLSEDELNRFVSEELGGVMGAESAPLSMEERRLMALQIRDDILGHGPVQMYLDDPTVTEVMVNGVERIYIERNGKLVETDTRFMSEEHLRRVIDRIVTGVGRRLDESSPMVDARLSDGSRVNAIVPPLAVDGPVLTIRKFAADPYQVQDLVEIGTMSQEVATLLGSIVLGKLNILVSGGTGSGKTTLLNVLSGFIPTDERIVTIEDAVELQLHQHHVIRLESRPVNVEGRGEVTIRDLVRNSLRMRPDRIVVGEVRGGEALDMLQAMNTGHEGSLSTVHANSPRDAIARLETMVLMAGIELPSRAIREQVASAIDVIVQLSRQRDGTRRITHLTEVVGMEGDTISMQDIFEFRYGDSPMGSEAGTGVLVPTGIRPKFSQRLADFGIPLPAALFGEPDLGFMTAGSAR